MNKRKGPKESKRNFPFWEDVHSALLTKSYELSHKSFEMLMGTKSLLRVHGVDEQNCLRSENKHNRSDRSQFEVYHMVNFIS
jgi:hypothetical protein